MSWSARRLLGLLPSGLPLPIVAGPLRGSLWLVDAAPGPSRGLSVCLGRSEPGQMRAAARVAASLRARGKRIALDIGAHTGIYSLLFARAGLKSYAFEPLPRNIAWLYRTLAVNSGKGRPDIILIPFGMGEKTSLEAFQEGEFHSMGHIAQAGNQPAMVVSLPDFCARYGVMPDLIKVDIEGGEAALLRGGAALLREHKPVLLLSTHGDALKKECFALLKEWGYGIPQPLDKPDRESASEFLIQA